MGTTDYMSPEQARGDDVDPRTDIWALGVVLYEMVAGRRPFIGSSRSDVLVAILDRHPEPLARFSPGAPAEIQRIVAKALRKDPDQRYQVMKDLLLDLEAVRDEIVSTERNRALSGTSSNPLWQQDVLPPVLSAQEPSRPRLSKTGKVAAAGLLSVVLTSLAWWTWRAAQLPSQAPRDELRRYDSLPYTRISFGSGLQTDPTFSPDGKFIAYASDRAGNFDIWVQALSAGSEPIQVTRSPAQDTQPSWSPDGARLVFRSERGQDSGLSLVPAFGGAEQRLTSFGSHPMWSADGKEILFFVSLLPMERASGNYVRLHAVSLNGEPPRDILWDFLRGGIWRWAATHPDGRISVLGQQRTRGGGFFTVSRNGDRVGMVEGCVARAGARRTAISFSVECGWHHAVPGSCGKGDAQSVARAS